LVRPICFLKRDHSVLREQPGVVKLNSDNAEVKALVLVVDVEEPGIPQVERNRDVANSLIAESVCPSRTHYLDAAGSAQFIELFQDMTRRQETQHIVNYDERSGTCRKSWWLNGIFVCLVAECNAQSHKMSAEEFNYVWFFFGRHRPGISTSW